MPMQEEAAKGLIPMYTPDDSQTKEFVVLNGSTVGIGDPIIPTVAGVFAQPISSAISPIGVCLGYVVGDGVTKVTVCIDPDMEYRVMGDDAYALADSGRMADIIAATPNVDTGVSNYTLDSSTSVNTGATPANAFVVIGSYEYAGASSTNKWYTVKIGSHFLL